MINDERSKGLLHRQSLDLLHLQSIDLLQCQSIDLLILQSINFSVLQKIIIFLFQSTGLLLRLMDLVHTYNGHDLYLDISSEPKSYGLPETSVNESPATTVHK